MELLAPLLPMLLNWHLGPHTIQLVKIKISDSDACV
jgi:hypothetical protein